MRKYEKNLIFSLFIGHRQKHEEKVRAFLKTDPGTRIQVFMVRASHK